MRQLETSTLSNQNIAAYLLAHTYTADADRAIFARIHIDQVAGGGDYLIYLTIQAGGTGSLYMEGPITTFTVPAAQTSIGFVSILIPVNSGDVVKFYVKGLTGDTTTPDIVTRIFELTYLRPTTAGRTLDVDANGGAEVGSFQAGAITAAAIATDAIDADALKTDAITEIQSGLATAANVTALGAAITQSPDLPLTGADLGITKYAAYDKTLSGMTIPADWLEIYVTCKRDNAEADKSAIWQLKVSNPAASGTDGLIYLNQALAEANRTKGSLTVSQSGGTVVIHIDAALTALLAVSTAKVQYTYDVKCKSTVLGFTKLARSASVSVAETETHAT